MKIELDKQTKAFWLIIILIYSLIGYSYYHQAQAIPIGQTVRAFVFQPLFVNTTGNSIFIDFTIIYYGNSNIDFDNALIQITAIDTSITIKQKITNTVLDHATTLGLILSQNDIIMFDIVKGI